MTLHAVLCGAPPGDPDACMAAIERFAESRSLWLKITAWEKGTVVQEVARLTKPRWGLVQDRRFSTRGDGG